ncbi:MAG: hypothetical protein J6Y94_07830, partial [Bacteriovoracaceae bacterium]|nr:hypothetical protein [Bacteriovoracaceae bacterium]
SREELKLMHNLIRPKFFIPVHGELHHLVAHAKLAEKEIGMAKDHILISRFDNISYLHNKEWNVTMGNETNNLAIFSQIKMKRSLSWRIRFLYYCLLKIMLGVIPRHSLRRRLREQLNARFYKKAL